MCLISANTAHLAADKVRLGLSADDPHLSDVHTHTHTHTHHSIPPTLHWFPCINSLHTAVHISEPSPISHELPAAPAGRSNHMLCLCVRTCADSEGFGLPILTSEGRKKKKVKNRCCLRWPKLTRAEEMVCFRSVMSRDTLLMMSECISGVDLSQGWCWENSGPLINRKNKSDTIKTCNITAWLKYVGDCVALFWTV